MALTELSKKKSTSFNSATGVDYVYEITTFWDDQAQKKVTKRRVVGKIDPVSKQEIPTGPRGRPRHEENKTADDPIQNPASPDSGNPPEDFSDKLTAISREISEISLRLEALQNMVDQLRG